MCTSSMSNDLSCFISTSIYNNVCHLILAYIKHNYAKKFQQSCRWWVGVINLVVIYSWHSIGTDIIRVQGTNPGQGIVLLPPPPLLGLIKGIKKNWLSWRDSVFLSLMSSYIMAVVEGRNGLKLTSVSWHKWIVWFYL